MERDALARARKMIDLWTREAYRDELDAIIINASGCGTVIKDYGYLFAHEPSYRVKAAKVARLAKDVCEFLEAFKLAATAGAPLRVAYHSACSMQHGQQLHEQPKRLLRLAGFEVVDVPEGHLCCGSAGTYNILQHEIAGRLRTRKIQHIESTAPDIVATGNIGCMTQLATGTSIPIVHTVELLDWATGGPQPFASEAIKRPEWRGSR
jgi:glycolate oxidase iron-sulfur subunit